jgi:CxxC motif-containing protein (DUF1111 family)
MNIGKPLPKTIRILLGLGLVASASGFAYAYARLHYIPAYGDAPEDLAYLEGRVSAAKSGGDLTTFKFGEVSFSEEAANLPWQMSARFDEGDGVFERPFRAASAGSQGSNADGLGPIFNREACESCHLSDGRSLPRPGTGLLVRLSVPGKGAHGGPKPHPVYGGQFGDRSVQDVPAEGHINTQIEVISGQYADGETYELIKPEYELVNLQYGELGDDTMTSPRAPLSVFGLGLLEAIPDQTLTHWADPEDTDKDGISGKLNKVWDMQHKKMAIGRFGWKAEQPSIATQAADAAANDMGVTTEFHIAQTCTQQQDDCNQTLHGGDRNEPEMSAQALDDVTTYLEFLAVPGRDYLDNPEVQLGENLFNDAQCSACHKSDITTGDEHRRRRLRGQTIHPYTDLLLHDMGEGLADHRPSFDADGREWRTAPLWGIGMVERVNGHTLFLHDGRARNLAEAILWHGGEAEAAKQRFVAMNKNERDALVKFLKSL